ncbi:hypothetical protein AB0C34_22055 [Nocardia sp. NPDC049220]|uniref:hypothetical protein n=1 Tax=Nocardia sp. NPDC049220 TaxID=3155273 RepID=UPI0033EE1637
MAGRSQNVTTGRDRVHIGDAESTGSGDTPAAAKSPDARPMDAYPTADADAYAQRQTVTISGNGPVMDDNPDGAESEPQVFTISGTGPIIDDGVEGAGR